MGYYTHYELDFTGMHNPEEDMKIIKALEKINPDYFHYNEREAKYGVDYLFEEEMKWYDHDTDMKDLSEQFPDKLFCLHGEGEDTLDLWHTYYKNGKMQFCPAHITYDEFDETKLH